MSDIDRVIEIDRELRPNLYKHVDAIALILDPAAFAGNWQCSDRKSKKLIKATQRYMQANARTKAHEILKYLGVTSHTDVDWIHIMRRMAEEDAK